MTMQDLTENTASIKSLPSMVSLDASANINTPHTSRALAVGSNHVKVMENYHNIRKK